MSTEEQDAPRIGSSSSFTDRTTWLRALFMVLFAIIYWVAEMVLTAVVVLQFLFVLATRSPNGRLLKF
ncbi:MAG: DUF4389 domain-containing protein, partial [Reinekea sp.]|nr:DUF4389 domain-containing protein [Reinekea sp.]